MKSIKTIPLLAVFVCLISFLSSCNLVEDNSGCPTDMRISFHINDRYETGNFDERIGNDILLYIFRDSVCVAKRIVPYSDIAQGKSYVIQKTELISGNLQMVAWGVPGGRSANDLPSWQIGDSLSSTDIFLEAIGNTGYYAAINNRLHLGTLSVNEKVYEPTSYSIGMNYCYCRVEAHVTERSGSILNVPGGARVHVLGSMSGMNMQLLGTGKDAIVTTSLDNPSNDKIHFTTGRFGIFPSAEGKTISIEIYAGNARVATLNVPRENMPKGAEAGGLLVFEYTINSDSFTLTVNGYRVNIYDVDRI